MHDVLKSFQQKPVPKISQKLQNFWKTLKLKKKKKKKKNLKVRSETWNAWKSERKKILPEEERSI